MSAVQQIFRLAWVCPLGGKRKLYARDLPGAYAERSIERAALEPHLRPYEDWPTFEVEPVHVGTENQSGYGWVAVTEEYDGPGSPIGSGPTEEAAVTNLVESLNTREEML